MNIFYIDSDPEIAARSLCDKHVVKMIVESAQMLSTAHRVLDGNMQILPSKSGKRMVKKWVLDNDLENILYKSAYENHICNVWVRESIENYSWLFYHFAFMVDEYERRYDRKHLTWTKLGNILDTSPQNIPICDFTQVGYALSGRTECIVDGDPVETYRNFYRSKKNDFELKWEYTQKPKWFDKST